MQVDPAPFKTSPSLWSRVAAVTDWFAWRRCAPLTTSNWSTRYGRAIRCRRAPVKPLFVTAGSGTTPAMSMLRALIAQERLPDTVHIHYAPHEFDVIFGQELRATAAQHPRYQLRLQLTRELGAETSSARHFSPAQLEPLCPDWRQREGYACGPQSLLDGRASLGSAGLSRRLHVERFRAAYAHSYRTVGLKQTQSSQGEKER